MPLVQGWFRWFRRESNISEPGKTKLYTRKGTKAIDHIITNIPYQTIYAPYIIAERSVQIPDIWNFNI